MTVGTDISTGVRHTGFLDAGVCSKTIRAVPAMSKYFRNLRNALTGLHSQTNSNTHAVNSLMQGQADINNEINLLNYWMRQVSPHMDKLNYQMQNGNDALAGIVAATSAPSINDNPGVPDAITLLPAPALDHLMLYFARPSYTGNAALSSYEIVAFLSVDDAMNWSNASDVVTVAEITLLTATETSPWNVLGCDDMYSMYGSDLRIMTVHDASILVGEVCIRIRSKNQANLWSPWSAPTMVCKAATIAADLAPFLDEIVTGAALSLVSWRVPMVQQSDKSYAIVGGIHSYMINTFIIQGGATSVAQIPLISGQVIVAACTDAVGLDDVGTSNSLTVTVPTRVPAPRLFIRFINSGTGTYAIVSCMIPVDYYSDVALRYTVTARNVNTNELVTNSKTGNDPAGLDFTYPTEVRIPAVGDLVLGDNYTFTAIAEHATSVGQTYTSLEGSASGLFKIETVSVSDQPSLPGPTVPSAPMAVEADAVPSVQGDTTGKASVRFTVSNTDTNTGLVTYTVTSSPDGKIATGSASPITVSGLTFGTSYTFLVTASNANGMSVPVASIAPFIPAAPVSAPPPATPIIDEVKAVPSTEGDTTGKVSVRFTSPNAIAPTTYTVTSSPGNLTASVSDTTTIIVSGLTFGTPYTFTVTATNVNGTSAPSASSNSITTTAPQPILLPPKVVEIASTSPNARGITTGWKNGTAAVGVYYLMEAWHVVVTDVEQGTWTLSGSAPYQSLLFETQYGDLCVFGTGSIGDALTPPYGVTTTPPILPQDDATIGFYPFVVALSLADVNRNLLSGRIYSSVVTVISWS